MKPETVTTKKELHYELEKYKEKAEVYGRLAMLYRNMLEKIMLDMEQAKRLLDQRGSFNERI